METKRADKEKRRVGETTIREEKRGREERGERREEREYRVSEKSREGEELDK